MAKVLPLPDKSIWIKNRQHDIISCQHNALAWLTEHDFPPQITLDTFRQVITVAGESLSDELIIELIRQIEADTMMHWSDTHVRSAVISMAARHQISSLTAWLDSLVWDGKARIDTFFAHTFHAEYSRYTAACGDVLFLSAVARAYQPGCKADVMIVLIGDQGIGKSRGLEELVPERAWYTDDLGDLYERKAGEGLQGKWLIEFGEFARINRSTLEVVKAFLSRPVDHFRPAYGRMAKDFPRQCVFIGTTNNDMPLQDLENRRFMPVLCRGYSGDIAKERDQLWAEAVTRYKAGVPWWISDPTLLKTVKEHQEDARQHDEWEEVLKTILVGVTKITLSEVAERLGIKPDRFDKTVQGRLALAMKTLGFIKKRESTGTRAVSWQLYVTP
jgi:predicted P-loop ATPase